MKSMKQIRMAVTMLLTVLLANVFGITDLSTVLAARNYEYAMFPNSRVYVSQTAYGSYSHRGKNVTDIVPSGRLTAPFSGTIRYIDRSWGYVILESDDKVVYADGTIAKMCCGFMHDSSISDLHVGMHIEQGQEFYDKGTKSGPGGTRITGAHVHVICMKGAFKNSMKSNYSSRGNVYIYNAFWLSPNTKIVKSGYSQSKWHRLDEDQVTPTLRVTTSFNAPTSIRKGKGFGLRGVITTDVGRITNVYAYIEGDDGIVYSYNANPNSTSWNARNTINNTFMFGRLARGTYTYYVRVTANNNGLTDTYTLSRTFRVK